MFTAIRRLTAEDWNRDIADLKRSAGPQGTFNYTFFKATGRKP